jgi:hypothetical protein
MYKNKFYYLKERENLDFELIQTGTSSKSSIATAIIRWQWKFFGKYGKFPIKYCIYLDLIFGAKT